MIRSLRTSILLLACCAAPALHAVGFAPPTGPDDLYARGTSALDQHRWQDAITDFDQVIDARGKRADAALYWKAYALNKLGRVSLVSATCNQLHTAYAASTWNKDCADLAGAEANGNSIAAHTEATEHSQSEPDYDAKALALNSLLNHEPTRAIPLIRNMLTGNGPQEMKHRALSVLAMNKSPEAQAALRDIALGKFAPAEQCEAIQMMGLFQGRSAGDTLTGLYRNTNDLSVKHSVISALFVSGDPTRLVDLARSEKNLSLKHDIVGQLALMNDKVATDYMLELLR